MEEPSVTTVKNSEYYANGFLLNLMKKVPMIEKHYQKMILKQQQEKAQKIKEHI